MGMEIGVYLYHKVVWREGGIIRVFVFVQYKYVHT